MVTVKQQSEANESSKYQVTTKNTVRLTRTMQRNFRPGAFESQMDLIIGAVHTTERMKRGWHAEVEGINGRPVSMFKNEETGMLVAKTDITVERNRESATIDEEFDQILIAIIRQGAAIIQNPGLPWTVEEVNGLKFDSSDELVEKADGEIGYAPIRRVDVGEFQSAFGDLFGVDAQIRLLRSSIESAFDSDWNHRFNVVLVGPPGCGKSELCKAIKALYGDGAVLELDGPSTTMAGAQKKINELTEMPRIVIIEEIEKVPSMDALSYLLSMLDTRAYIKKTTAKGNIDKDTKVLAIVTCNNWGKFKRIASGALRSRFTNPIKFGRPSRQTLELILQREIAKVPHGNKSWIAPTLDFCERNKVRDPRTVIALCLNGRDRWFDGTYEEDVLATMILEEEDDALTPLTEEGPDIDEEEPLM